MKRSFTICIIFVLAFAFPVAHAENWELVDQTGVKDDSEDRATANRYVDKDSITRKGDIATINTKINGRASLNVSYFDCNKKQALEFTEAHPVEDGTPEYKLFKLACKSPWLPW